MENLVSLARDFALRHHKEIISTTVSGLKRPQILHLQEVADLTWVSGGSDEEVAAAWLHDSVEDTSATIEDIKNAFGETVALIVDGLTDPEGFSGLPLADRKRKQAERIRTESASVKRVKIADQTSNVRSLVLDPTITMTPFECKQYVEGAKAIVEECEGISPLLDSLFSDVCNRGRERFAHASATANHKSSPSTD